jgi:transposase-like protein
MAKRGIGRVERERRKRLVAKWRRSGQSAAKFAEGHGLSQWALYSWTKRPGAGSSRGRGRPVGGSRVVGAADLIPVRLVGEEPAHLPARREGVVEIQVRGGDVVRVVGEVSAEQLAAVLRAVRQEC